MKKLLLTFAFTLLLASGLLPGEETVSVLALEEPTSESAKKNTLMLSLPHLEKLGAGLIAEAPTAVFLLLDQKDWALATLGSVKKGMIKWDYKTVNDRFLAVVMTPSNYALLAAIIKTRTPRPGCKLAACDAKTGGILASSEVTFWEFPDLAVQLNYPVNAELDEPLQDSLTVLLENRGGGAARNIQVDVVLSPDEQIQWPGTAAAGNDVLLANGRETVPILEPGQQVMVRFRGILKLPDRTPPGKHYLAALADPANEIEELSEANNLHSGFIMTAAPEPAAFTVDIPETVLVFEPANYGFKIAYGDIIFSDGKDWKLCRMRPYTYQIKHVSWQDFFWEIDTVERKVYEITGAGFCKKGGKDRALAIKVEVSGGSLTAAPSRFALKLAQTRLRFEPQAKKFTLLAYEKNICHLPFWWVCRRESYLYQMRYTLWQNYFWQVDTFTGEASQVSDGKFCSSEGNAARIPLQVTVEKK